jgi:hypothetical protein
MSTNPQGSRPDRCLAQRLSEPDRDLMRSRRSLEGSSDGSTRRTHFEQISDVNPQ